MEKKEEDVFEGVEMDEFDSVETPEQPEQPLHEMATTENIEFVAPDVEFGELSSSEKKDIMILEEDKTKVFEIESAEILKPRLVDVDGKLIEPKVFNEKDPTKKGYTTKLSITYKDSNYLSLLPNIKWYIGVNANTGKKVLNPWFNTTVTKDDLTSQYTSEISKLYFKYCEKFGHVVGKLTQNDFVAGLKGKQVKLKQWSTKWEGTTRYRLDISEFVE